MFEIEMDIYIAPFTGAAVEQYYVRAHINHNKTL